MAGRNLIMDWISLQEDGKIILRATWKPFDRKIVRSVDLWFDHTNRWVAFAYEGGETGRDIKLGYMWDVGKNSEHTQLNLNYPYHYSLWLAIQVAENYLVAQGEWESPTRK